MIEARGRGARRRGAAWAVLAMALAYLVGTGPLAAAERLGTYESAEQRFHLVKVTEDWSTPGASPSCPTGGCW